MPAVFDNKTHAVLPLDVSREQVIEHIQKHETIFGVQSSVDHAERLFPDKPNHSLADNFFTQDKGSTDVVTYVISERLPIVPYLGISKAIKFLVHYQDFANGVRARVDGPGGTTVRATYVVRPLKRYGAELRRGAWRLIEEAQVECNPLVKPFVVKTFQDTHTDICQRILDGLRSDINTQHALGKE